MNGLTDRSISVLIIKVLIFHEILYLELFRLRIFHVTFMFSVKFQVVIVAIDAKSSKATDLHYVESCALVMYINTTLADFLI